MKPWYRGFIGRIEENGKGGFDSVGIIEPIGDHTYFVSELPVKMWTQPYKEFLEDMLQAGIAANAPPSSAIAKAQAKAKAKAGARGARGTSSARAKAGLGGPTAGGGGIRRGFQSSHKLTIDDYRDNSTHESIAFTIKLNPEQLAVAEALGGLEKAFKLRKTITTTNMTLFDEFGQVRKYLNELEILKSFCRVRLEFYRKRKQYRILNLQKELCLISNKLKFILEVVAGDLKVSNTKKAQLELLLQQRGYETMEQINSRYNTANKSRATEISADGTLQAEEESDAESDPAADGVSEGAGGGSVPKGSPSRGDTGLGANQYDYLLTMQIYSLTYERVEQLRKQQQAKEVELDAYRRKTPHQLWLDDLDELETAMVEADLVGSEEKAEAERARRLAQGLAAPARPLQAAAPKRRTTKKAGQPTKVKKEHDNTRIADEDDDEALFSKLNAASVAAAGGISNAASSDQMGFMDSFLAGMKNKSASKAGLFSDSKRTMNAKAPAKRQASGPTRPAKRSKKVESDEEEEIAVFSDEKDESEVEVPDDDDDDAGESFEDDEEEDDDDAVVDDDSD